VFAVIFMGEKFNFKKLVAIAVNLLGIGLILMALFSSKQKAGPNPPLGDWLTVSSAFFCGLYDIAYKMLTCKEEVKYGPHSPKAQLGLYRSFVRTTLCLGGLGVSFMAMTPILVVMDYTGWEKFELPRGFEETAPLLLNAAIMPMYDFSFALSLQLNPAILVGFATALVMPLSFVCDYFRHGMPIPWSGLFGAVIVVYGLKLMDGADAGEEHASTKVADANAALLPAENGHCDDESSDEEDT